MNLISVGRNALRIKESRKNRHHKQQRKKKKERERKREREKLKTVGETKGPSWST